MSGFDDREKAMESKYVHDQQLQFRIMNRRNKLVGLWAAGLMGIEDAETYAKAVVKADFDEPGDEDVIRKVMADFQAHNVEMSEHRLRKHLEETLVEARRQIMEDR